MIADEQLTVRYVEKKSEPARLIVFERKGRVWKQELGVKCRIGRKSENSECDLQIDAGVVSKKHGVFIQDMGEYYYEDTHSLNGTEINGILIGSNSPYGNRSAKLSSGDVFRIGFEGQNDIRGQAVAMVFTTDCASETEWESLLIDEDIQEISIGRSDTKIALDNAMVSKNHASFFKARRGWAIDDHNSTNGVFLNGIRIKQAKYLYPMDVVTIANLHFFYDGKQIWYPIVKKEKKIGRGLKEGVKLASANGEELVIKITERTVKSHFKKKTLLEDINITIHEGEMVMLLGGSGAGKTTFMNAVMGYEKAKGTITLGDTDIYKEYEKMKYKIGFAQQSNLLRMNDTVWNTLNNAAEMKMPDSVSEAERKEQIDRVLDLFGLAEEKNNLVSKLSGGQQKRLNIAVEYVAEPKLFFLDEPDSGVDPGNTINMMESYRKIADSGKIVMVITHTPDRVAYLFDKVIVLAKSIKDNCGRLAYFGSIDGAYEFFETDSLEGIIKRINRKNEGGEGLSDFFIEKYKDMQR